MKIQRQAAVMFASDLPRSIRYWNEFATHGTFLEPPVFAIMERDSHFVMLKQLPAGDTISPYAERDEGLWNAYFWVDNAKAVRDQFQRRGAVIDYDLLRAALWCP